MTSKKIWGILLVFCLILTCLCTLAACGGNDETGSEPVTESETKPNVTESAPDSESEPSSDTEADTDPTPEKITYTVNITDFKGQAFTGTAVATVKKNGMSDAFIPIKNGTGSIQLDADTYTVILTIPGGYYYEESYALTPEQPTLNVTLSKLNSNTQTIQIDYVNYEAVLIEEGATYVSLEDGRSSNNFVGERTYFVFTPQRDGIYKVGIIADGDATLGYYGSPLNIFEDTLIDVVDGYIEIPIHSSSLGGAQFTLGITTSELDNCIITVERDRDMPKTAADVEWTDILPTRPLDTVNLTYSNREAVLNTLNITDPDLKVVLNTEDGLYHLGAEDGPVVYLRIKSVTDYFGIDSETGEYNFASFFGISELSRIGVYYYDDNGDCVLKENYNTLVMAYGEVCDPTTGVYPLDEALASFLKTYGDYTGWWDYESESNLFDFYGVERPPVENAWLFAACTVSYRDKGDTENSPISVSKAEGATLILNSNTHYYLKISQIKDVVLTVYGADSNTKVVYNGQTYTPDENGIITVTLAGDPRANIRFEIIADSGSTNDLVVTCAYEIAPENIPETEESETDPVTETEPLPDTETESGAETEPEDTPGSGIAIKDQQGRPIYNFKVEDAYTGEALKGITIKIYMDNAEMTVVGIGRTDAKGFVAITLDSAEFEYYYIALENVPSKYDVETYALYPEYNTFYYYDMPIRLMDPQDYLMDGRDEHHGVIIYSGDTISLDAGQSLWFSAPRTAGKTMTINNVPDDVLIFLGDEIFTATNGQIKIKFPTQIDDTGTAVDANYSSPNVFQVVNNGSSALSLKITVN